MAVTLPARVRTTRPLMPLAPALRSAVIRLCPEAPINQLQVVTLAIAGGSVIGVHARWQGQKLTYLEAGWRGKGIEKSLEQLLEPVNY